MSLDVVITGETEHPRSVVLLLHGSGGNAGAMAQAADIFHQEIPDALILIPDGPRALWNWDGFDWFKPDFDVSPRQFDFNIKPALDGLNELIDFYLEKYGLTNKDLALFGFSMGGMIGMYTAFRRPEPCAVVLCHSAMYMQEIEPRSKPSVVMVMGAENIENIERHIRSGESSPHYSYGRSVGRLQAQGIPVAEYIVPGLAHTMIPESLRKSARIVNDGLNGGREISAAILPVRQDSGLSPSV